MRLSLLACTKVVLQILFVTIFLAFFGLPAWKKFGEKKVMIVHSKRVLGSIPGPAVTICRRDRSHGDGVNMFFKFELCDNATDIVKCINQETYNRSEVIAKVELGVDTRRSLTNRSLWVEDFTETTSGRCYTLTVPKMITADYRTDQIIFHLPWTPTASYNLYVHDGNFILNENFFGIQCMHKKILVSENAHFYMVEHHKLNLPSVGGGTISMIIQPGHFPLLFGM